MKYKEKSMIRGTGEEIGGNECKVPISCYVAIQFLMASKLSDRSYLIDNWDDKGF